MENNNHVKKKMPPKVKAVRYISVITTILAYAMVAVFILLSYRYYTIELKTIMFIIGAIICLLLIIGIMFYVGFRYKDFRIGIATVVLSLLVTVFAASGVVVINKVNKTVDNIIDNSGKEQYEIVGGVFTYYQKNANSTIYTDFDDIKNAKNLTVGVLYDNGVGTGTMAKELLEKENVDAKIVQFNTTDDLLSALVGEEEKTSVDLAVFPASYRQRLLNDDNVDYSQYLDRMVDFYSFEEKVLTGENENANKDLSGEPFNILLIGFAPENEAMTYGLADSIIVATVNPQTLTVVMTSIARDSFVPISCYGGSRDKINAARGTSRACLMETVGNLLDMKIDYYMEVNFLGVVQIVDAIGGILINNPVEFVGQSASTNRGEYTVLVPAGEAVPADGEMALAFARERHAMPGGDFDRQKHQQEVIAEIVRGLLELRDVNKALKVMEAAGNNISTNLSLNQLTGVFNYLLSIKNENNFSTFNMIDIQSMRVTGYSSWTYNQSMKLPLWIYKLYNGSIKEATDRIDDVMNEYGGIQNISDQHSYMKFQVQFPYNRGLLYSTYFNEEQVHEQLPTYYPFLTKYSYEEAVSWAVSNGVTLNITFIDEDSPNYIESQRGRVVDQFPRQGSLVSEYPTGSITVMGSMDPNYAPSYTVENCNDLDSCKAFADSKGISMSIEYKTTTDASLDGKFIETNYKNGDKIKKNQTLVVYIWKLKEQVEVPDYTGMKPSDYMSLLTGKKLNPVIVEIEEGATELNNGTIAKTNPAVGQMSDGKVTIYVYKYVAPKEPLPGDTDKPNTGDGTGDGENPGTTPGGEDKPNTGGETGGGGNTETPPTPDQPQTPDSGEQSGEGQ
ncbi:MAG: LCP family protein [Erysipelotrichaceae bacterium]|nr:LCP family protein [Erysipelotrichaceae bacterium]